MANCQEMIWGKLRIPRFLPFDPRKRVIQVLRSNKIRGTSGITSRCTIGKSMESALAPSRIVACLLLTANSERNFSPGPVREKDFVPRDAFLVQEGTFLWETSVLDGRISDSTMPFIARTAFSLTTSGMRCA